MNNIFYFVMILLIIPQTCLAMIFSQPVKIGGGVTWSQAGGFLVNGAINNKVENNFYRGGRITERFSKGVAQFGNGNEIVYEHYDYEKYKTQVLIGDENTSNTFSVEGIENGLIYSIKNDSNIKMYMILLGNDIHWEDGYLIFGKRADGRFVKYLDTYELRKKYFGNSGSSITFGDIVFNKDTITIFYEQQTSLYKFTRIGEFRFKWDEEAQWFGIEQVVY